MPSPSSKAEDVKTANFDRVVLASKLPVVVDFWAPWCGWCKKLAPIYDEFAAKYSDRLKFVKVNVEEERALAEKYGISSLPTLKYFCGGREIGEQVGAPPRDRLEAGFNDILEHYTECLATSNPIRK
jgi:thioredoxin 1